MLSFKRLVGGAVAVSIAAILSFTGLAATAQPEPLADMIERVQDGVVRVYEQNGAGSGFVIERGGGYYVLTNHHVIDTGSPSVVLSDGTRVTVSVVAQTAIKDIAILRLNTSRDLTTLNLAAEARIGGDVVVLGYPLNLNGSMTITRGIISAFRAFNDAQWIQTDAAVNPGNSGGPMLNARGEVVAMITSIENDAAGIAYAIRYDTLKDYVDQHLGASTPSTPTNYEPTFYGPVSGELTHTLDEIGLAEAKSVFLRDSITEAWFKNPHDGHARSWSYGFWLRVSEDAEAHLIAIRSDGNWTHEYYPPSGEQEQWIWDYTPAIRAHANAYNHLRVIAMDDVAWVFINRMFVGTTILRAHVEPGGVFIFSGLFEEDNAGVTTYEDFTIRSICCE